MEILLATNEDQCRRGYSAAMPVSSSCDGRVRIERHPSVVAEAVLPNGFKVPMQ
jgi:hypothetical protein